MKNFEIRNAIKKPTALMLVGIAAFSGAVGGEAAWLKREGDMCKEAQNTPHAEGIDCLTTTTRGSWQDKANFNSDPHGIYTLEQLGLIGLGIGGLAVMCIGFNEESKVEDRQALPDLET